MSTIDEHAATLLARLDKEIARVEAGTVALGGLAKAGNALEALLRLCASTYCRNQGTRLDDQLQRAGVSRGAGSYAKVLEQAPRGTLGHVVSEALAGDLRLPRSRIRAAIDMRNAAAHPGSGPTAPKAVFRDVAAILRPLVKSPPT
jgi:hypothetical protein